MKVCFCGLGSIGIRHLRNFVKVTGEFDAQVEIHALRMTNRVLGNEIKGVIARQVTDKDKLDRDYDIAFITNPTSLHYDTIRMMADRSRHMFIEKPIFDDREYQISALHLKKNGVYYVAGPLRYSGVIQSLKEVIPKEKVYSIRVICSSYLPDWRPGTDYRETYSARKALGGGVALDLIHEWDYIAYLFGLPQKICCIRGKYSHLEIDSDDTAIYIAAYKDKTVELHLDYFGRKPRREIELFTDKGIITGNLISHTVFFTDSGNEIRFDEEKNDVYMKEMRFFMDHIIKRQPLNNLDICHSVLNISLGRGIQ